MKLTMVLQEIQYLKKEVVIKIDKEDAVWYRVFFCCRSSYPKSKKSFVIRL